MNNSAEEWRQLYHEAERDLAGAMRVNLVLLVVNAAVVVAYVASRLAWF